MRLGANRVSGTAFVAAAVAAVVAAVALAGCTSSVGGTAGGSSPASTGPSAATSSPSSPSGSATSAASSTPAAGAGVNCATVSINAAFQPIGIFTPGGTLPAGVPLPQAVPAFTCKATANRERVKLVAVSWTSVSAEQYAAQLSGTGWKTEQAHGLEVFHKSGARYAIVLGTVGGQLVAVYGPPH